MRVNQKVMHSQTVLSLAALYYNYDVTIAKLAWN